MDETNFQQFLKQNKKDSKVIQGYTVAVRRFETYLAERGRTLASARPEEIRKSPHGGLLALAMYYEFLGEDRLCAAAHEAFAAPSFATFKVYEFLGIRPEAVQALKVLGIVTARDMLEAGGMPAQRCALAQASGIPIDEILTLVKLSDQARIGGHKRIRARLFHEAGLDTLDKIAACEPQDVCLILKEYIESSGFDGIPPTLREAANSVRMARYLPRVLKYE